jgi:nicotinamidase-related amidase
MIMKFNNDTALILIDVQKGVDDLEHWGGVDAHRNNIDAETKMASLLADFRAAGRTTILTQHNSREATSPLRLSVSGGEFKEGFEPQPCDIVIAKDVNSSFVGTNLELELTRAGINRLVIGGLFTNFCVETTVRMAGNMGYDTYLAEDACSTTTHVGADGTVYPADIVHKLSVANMHGEFCTAISTNDALLLSHADAPHLDRVQGNE